MNNSTLLGITTFTYLFTMVLYFYYLFFRNKKLGFVFQSYNLLPKLTALANVELPMIYAGTGQRRKRAREALETVGIGQREFLNPGNIPDCHFCSH